MKARCRWARQRNKKGFLVHSLKPLSKDIVCVHRENYGLKCKGAKCEFWRLESVRHLESPDARHCMCRLPVDDDGPLL